MSAHSVVEVLLVEDNPLDAEMALRTMRKSNLANHVVHVEDGAKALDWIFGAGAYVGRKPSNHPRVVLLDQKLPKVDGLEVLRAIRADERTRLMPVVVMTSSREERNVMETYKLGVNSYIVKPMDFEGFFDAVAELGHHWPLVNQRPG